MEFHSLVGQEKIEDICNPGRGFYVIHYFTLGEKVDYENLYWCIDRSSKLSFVFISLERFKDRNLDADALGQVKEILAFFCLEKRDVVLRVAYDMSGEAKEKEPSSFSLVAQHMKAVCEVLQQVESVYIWQGLLLGNWGEMHGSEYISPRCLGELAQIQRNCFEHPTFYFAVRSPMLQRMTDITRGIFDDGILGSVNHMGSFAVDGDPAERKAVVNAYKLGPFGGETIYDPAYSAQLSAKEVLFSLRELHPTYLNKAHDMRFITSWKEQLVPADFVEDNWRDKSLYDYIEAHLGYRLLIQNITLTVDGLLQITITNLGFAPLYFDVRVQLFCDEKELPLAEGMLEKGFSNDASKTFCFELLGASGAIHLRLSRCRDDRQIYLANEGEQDERGILLGIV